MAKIAAKGAILKVTIAAVLTVVPACGDIALTLPDTARVDVTTHDSPDSTREFVQTWLGEGSLSTTLKYQPENAVHEYLRAAHGGAAVAFTLTLPDSGNAVFAFSAHVTGFEVSAPVDGALDAKISIKTTGVIVFTA